jgi:hypothetical protein
MAARQALCDNTVKMKIRKKDDIVNPVGRCSACPSTLEFLLSPGKIFCLVSTLFGLKTTDIV